MLSVILAWKRIQGAAVMTGRWQYRDLKDMLRRLYRRERACQEALLDIIEEHVGGTDMGDETIARLRTDPFMRDQAFDAIQDELRKMCLVLLTRRRRAV